MILSIIFSVNFILTVDLILTVDFIFIIDLREYHRLKRISST
jgi:hypothetical protein